MERRGSVSSNYSRPTGRAQLNRIEEEEASTDNVNHHTIESVLQGEGSSLDYAWSPTSQEIAKFCSDFPLAPLTQDVPETRIRELELNLAQHKSELEKTRAEILHIYAEHEKMVDWMQKIQTWADAVDCVLGKVLAERLDRGEADDEEVEQISNWSDKAHCARSAGQIAGHL